MLPPAGSEIVEGLCLKAAKGTIAEAIARADPQDPGPAAAAPPSAAFACAFLLPVPPGRAPPRIQFPGRAPRSPFPESSRTKDGDHSRVIRRERGHRRARSGNDDLVRADGLEALREEEVDAFDRRERREEGGRGELVLEVERPGETRDRRRRASPARSPRIPLPPGCRPLACRPRSRRDWRRS